MSSDEIEKAAALLRAGELVAFPTETVYGLGANALDAHAVARIYAAKGRPATSPLIVHVSSVEMARELASEWPPIADKLAETFWPGPLTLIVRKRAEKIPDIVTAGLGSVGLRMPAHPIALALLRAAQIPIAAPSANRFTELSPTTAEHVRESLGGRVGCILDGGPCEVGIESTVLSLVTDPPALLRPGMVSADEIAAVVGPIRQGSGPVEQGQAHASPGLHERHYSPRTPLYLQPSRTPEGRGICLYINQAPPFGTPALQMPSLPKPYALALYETLHRLDHEGWDWIAVEAPPADPSWDAIRDRLRRAAATG